MSTAAIKSSDKKIYLTITKRDDEKRMVYGYASTDALDSDGEIIEKDAISAALPEYMQFGNIREMHQKSAVGKAKEADFDDKGLYIGAKIVDDQAWAKVKEEVYNGFSIGAEVESRLGNKITKLKLKEISLVDRPANPECLFEVFKSEDTKPAQMSIEEVVEPVKILASEKIEKSEDTKKVTAVQKLEEKKPEVIEKGMGTLAQLCWVYDSFEMLRQSVHYEEEFEGDLASSLPKMMDEACEKIGEIILAMAAEEVSETLNQGEAVDKEKIEKADDQKDELEARRKAMKEAAASAMKTYKDEMDKLEEMSGKMDKATAEELDEMEKAMAKTDDGEEEEEESAEEKAEEKKDDSEADKLAKSAKRSSKEIIEKLAADKAKKVELASSERLISLVEKLDSRLSKLEDLKLPPRALRVVDKEGKQDIAKMASDSPAEFEKKVAAGEIDRSEAFKHLLAGAARSVIA